MIFASIFDVFLRRRKIIIFSTSVLFSIFTVNTLNNFFRNPIYQGSFSLLISDPIDKFKKSGSSFEERVISNNQIIELPTLIQFLKSQQVLRPLEKEIDSRHQALIDEKNATIEHTRSLEESLRTSQRRVKELEIVNSCQNTSSRHVSRDSADLRCTALPKNKQKNVHFFL